MELSPTMTLANPSHVLLLLPRAIRPIIVLLRRPSHVLRLGPRHVLPTFSLLSIFATFPILSFSAPLLPVPITHHPLSHPPSYPSVLLHNRALRISMPRLSPRVYVQQMLLVRSVWLMPKIWLVTEMAATLAHQWCEGLVGEEESQQHMRVERSLVDSLWMQTGLRSARPQMQNMDKTSISENSSREKASLNNNIFSLRVRNMPSPSRPPGSCCCFGQVWYQN